MHKGRSFSKIENLGNFGLKILGISDFSSAIILAVISFLSGLGWMLDRKKHRQEVESLKADNRMKDMELGMGFCLEDEQKRLLIDGRYYKADLASFTRNKKKK